MSEETERPIDGIAAFVRFGVESHRASTPGAEAFAVSDQVRGFRDDGLDAPSAQ